MGRPSKYRPEFCDQARQLCKLGATDADIARFFKISTGTLDAWKGQHPEFLSALRLSKAQADKRVEESLFRRAIGYEHDDTDIRVVAGKIVKTTVRKHYPPDTTACIFWLKNRNRKDWRDRFEAGIGGADDGKAVSVEVKPDEKLVAVARALLQKV